MQQHTESEAREQRLNQLIMSRGGYYLELNRKNATRKAESVMYEKSLDNTKIV